MVRVQEACHLGVPGPGLALHDEQYGQISVMSWPRYNPSCPPRSVRQLRQAAGVKCHLIRVTVTRLLSRAVDLAHHHRAHAA